MRYFTIGKLAKEAKITKVAIRYYERHGLLPKALRRASGYRHYSESILPRIRFIQNAKSVGFTLNEIAELFALQEDEKSSSQQIKLHAIAKCESIQKKMVILQKMAATLEKLIASCDGKIPIEECPILETLYETLI